MNESTKIFYFCSSFRSFFSSSIWAEHRPDRSNSWSLFFLLTDDKFHLNENQISSSLCSSICLVVKYKRVGRSSQMSYLYAQAHKSKLEIFMLTIISTRNLTFTSKTNVISFSSCQLTEKCNRRTLIHPIMIKKCDGVQNFPLLFRLLSVFFNFFWPSQSSD